MLTKVQSALQRATPESQGIASSAILKFVEAVDSQVHEFHSFMLLRHGKVVAEGWWSPYGREIPHMMFSLSKSFTSTAVGLAIAEGYFSLDDLVTSFFPDDAPAEPNEHLAALKVRHLLSMSTGSEIDTTGRMFEQMDGNWIKAFFDVPVVHEPGTKFLYNTGATYLLSAIVQKKTGMKLIDFLTPRLFEPLGIEGAWWEESPQGINIGGFGLNAKTEDIARLGQLYLQKGMWGDQRILSEAWVEEATAFHTSNGDRSVDSDWTQGYGYQFWQCQHGFYRGDGAFGQYCVVMPEHDVVLAITGGMPDMQQPLDLVWQILLPAMGTDTLPDDSVTHDKLTGKLSSLAFRPVEGKASSPTAATVLGRVYKFDANEVNLETVTLNDAGDVCRVTMKRDGREETFACGYGTWAQGETSLFDDPWRDDLMKIVSSAAWTAEDVLMTVVRLYETPFFHTATFHFSGDQLLLETYVNVSFMSTKPIVLSARAV